jgi:hypothetical protein
VAVAVAGGGERVRVLGCSDGHTAAAVRHGQCVPVSNINPEGCDVTMAQLVTVTRFRAAVVAVAVIIPTSTLTNSRPRRWLAALSCVGGRGVCDRATVSVWAGRKCATSVYQGLSL